MLSLEQRYYTDAKFAHIVDYLSSLLEGAEFTPTEMREAALLAQLKYEERRPRPVMFDNTSLQVRALQILKGDRDAK